MTRSIYYDPTESSMTSLLPASVIKSGAKITGFEEMTGADYLLSIYDKSLPSRLKSIVPHKRLLKLHCGHHGILIQRKSGNDLLSSIPRLEEIFNRMYKWTVNPVLLITGIFTQTKKGMVKVNNRVSDWNY